MPQVAVLLPQLIGTHRPEKRLSLLGDPSSATHLDIPGTRQSIMTPDWYWY
jgi:hypothetical protein